MNMRSVLTRLSAQPAKADIELWSTDVVALLGAPQGLLDKVAGAVTNSAVDAGEKAGAVVLAPFEPRSFRDSCSMSVMPSMPIELGFVLSGSLFNARPEEAETAIGGFEVLNAFGARDVQREEMNSGFGPQKAKHFASAISNDGVTRPARST
jgi:Fumarylacetoacetate (FAA) hydrolase family